MRDGKAEANLGSSRCFWPMQTVKIRKDDWGSSHVPKADFLSYFLLVSLENRQRQFLSFGEKGKKKYDKNERGFNHWIREK